MNIPVQDGNAPEYDRTKGQLVGSHATALTAPPTELERAFSSVNRLSDVIGSLDERLHSVRNPQPSANPPREIADTNHISTLVEVINLQSDKLDQILSELVV